MKDIIAKIIASETELTKDEIINLIEIPPKPKMGDFAFPCFGLAKIIKKNPVEISKELSEKINRKLPAGFSEIKSTGGYLNFFIDKKTLIDVFLKNTFGENFGKNNFSDGKKIVIDMSAPNIAKPFGIGHLRSTIIGNSISNIARMNGFETVKINYLGDWGTQFGKLILAYKKWGDGEELKKEPIKHLQELYVKVNADETLEDEARAEFKKLEEGDEQNRKLWEKFRKLSMKEFEKIYNLLGVEFDVISGESEYNDKMENIVELLREKKLLEESDGAEIVNLKNEGLGVVLIKKSDGTSLYATRDLAAVLDRHEKFNFDKMIYEVGQEQKLHFRQLFLVLEKMGFEWAKNCVHVSHGLYLDKDGKKFATRFGKTVLMQDLLDEVIGKAEKNLLERKMDEKEVKKRAVKIALAAIFYGDLKNSPENNIIFDVDKFLSFEGDTGPYLLYSYARANSIVKKAKGKNKDGEYSPDETETKLIKKILEFPEVVKKSYQQFAPNVIANYSFELSQIFNEFYHASQVIGSEQENFRLKLVDGFRLTLKKSLELLGIETLEEM